MSNAVTNILVVGIGGQGVMTATEILAEAAISLGHDAKKTEVAGMAQRGGVVSSHLRFGPKVLSPQITAGEADLLVGFEAAEALRWCHYLKPGGLVLSSTESLAPLSVATGKETAPSVEEIRAKIMARCATALVAPAESRMAQSRSIGSASWVARLTRLRVAWVRNSVLPCARNEIGMAAISALRGSAP